MEEMPKPQDAQREEPEIGEVPPPLVEDAPLIDRAVEINSGSAPRKSVRQRLGSMAARRSERRYDSGAEQPHLAEQAVIAEMSRIATRRTVSGPRTA